MRRHGQTTVMAGAVLLALTTVAHTQPVAIGGGERPSLAPLLAEVTPAVVNISVWGSGRRHRIRYSTIRFSGASSSCRRASNPSPRRVRASAPGVIVDAEKGYVLTNHHVIADAEEIIVTLTDRRQLDREADWQRSRHRRRAARHRRDESARRAAWQLQGAPSRRLCGRDRQPVRARTNGDLRYRQRARTQRHQRGGLRRFHPDRCLDQPRQLRRRADQSRRRAHRHQYGHSHAGWRQRRHRFCRARRHGEAGDQSSARVWRGPPRPARCLHSELDARSSRGARARRRRKAQSSRRWSRAPRPSARTSRPAT